MNESSSRFKSFTGSFTVRLFLIGFLILILLVPLIMIGFLIEERQERYEEAQNEIASKWGGSQLIAGPVLQIPYIRAGKNSTPQKHYLNVFPETLTIDVNATPEVRSRGIFDILLYTADIKINATFPAIQSVHPQINNRALEAEGALLTLTLSDPHGLQEELTLVLDKNRLPLQTVSTFDYHTSVFQTDLFSFEKSEKHTVELQFMLKGSEQLQFVPAGKRTTLAMYSSWAFPSFSGSILPSTREIKNDGFTASWNVTNFTKNLPQTTDESAGRSDILIGSLLEHGQIGVDLFFPTDFYQKTTRSVKYGVLFVVFTFLAFFLFEVMQQLRVHPFQYLLVGIALSIFYLLLISLAEHIGFLPAYVAASVATISLITLYCMKIFNSRKRGGIIGGVLVILYAYLYFILNNTDYALLIGSVSLFLITALVMYLTRNINWYKVEEH